MPTDPAAGGAGNILTRHYGPLPGYAYLAGAAVAGYIVIRHRNAAADTTAAADSSATDAGAEADTGTADAGISDADTTGNDFATPYDMSGQVYSTLAGVEANLQKDQGTITSQGQRITNQQQRIGTQRKRINQLRGQVAPKTRLVTVHKGDNKSALAARYHTTVREIEKLNPVLRKVKLRPGARVLVPVQTAKQKAAAR